MFDSCGALRPGLCLLRVSRVSDAHSPLRVVAIRKHPMDTGVAGGSGDAASPTMTGSDLSGDYDGSDSDGNGACNSRRVTGGGELVG